MSNTSAVPSINMGALLGAPESNPEPKSALETALATVTPEDAAAGTMEQVKFQFRELLNEQQLKDLKTNAPAAVERLVGDYNAIISFGAPVLQKLNDASVELLNEQRDIKIPEAELIVNNLLRQMDGYEARFRNEKAENIVDGIRDFFDRTRYSFKAMVRESKPIIDKLDIAEGELKEMEIKLADNVTAGQRLHKASNKALTDVVGVLAAFEEFIDLSRAEFKEADDALKSAQASAGPGQLVNVQYKGKTISVQELQDRHTDLANTISEMEKSWFDWRQQFFLGYAGGPTTLNLILVSATMQRRCQVFRTMGIPQARKALVSWQQATLAKEGAAMGTALQDGTNKIIQASAGAAADAVVTVAMASQTPLVSEETVYAIIDSVKKQCEGLVAADIWGRQQRSKNLQVLEAGEKTISQNFTESRRALVANAVNAVRAPQDLAPAPEADILKQIGVGV